MARIDAHLGHPSRDPHGDPIPSADGEPHLPDATVLAHAAADRPLRVRRISDEDPRLLREPRRARHRARRDARARRCVRRPARRARDGRRIRGTSPHAGRRLRGVGLRGRLTRGRSARRDALSP
ncbi:hypothetical protein [Clavibacter tessellarius]|uniref:hypothetical protein n=1 Tax=Clavibacter tessellarius TaxID=31965 RepID=UPI0039BFE6F3